MRLDIEDFHAFIRTIDRRSFRTLHQGALFDVQVLPSGLYYTLASTGKSRMMEWRYIERIASRFADTGSLHPSDYRDISVRSAYVLAVISHYLRSSVRDTQ